MFKEDVVTKRGTFTDEVSTLFGPTIAISYLFHLFGCCLSLLQVLSGVRRDVQYNTEMKHLVQYIIRAGYLPCRELTASSSGSSATEYDHDSPTIVVDV
ncbi:hypothetical protein EVAR_34663_1 [Eumeta japonica]|uniref:Uncharacterized protein n=1 Tax=Eumeta variegata TaxID=151549 RepID=A0A4C1VFJ5_EUMVA|nr:hypothetical protein EVAR_34663_1 [Eumeta japonica]